MAITFKSVLASGGTSLTIQISTDSAVLYGQTITISKGGSTVGTTAFDNQGEAEYTVDESGTYTVSVTYSGTTFSDTVDVTDTFDATIHATPDGSTVTPVNDIQIWLHCGNVWDKNYTTLSEVLADTTTLLALINSNNAVDYMVRSHDWCDDVCADATAMTYIGANDYAADTLLADDNPGLVPTMTSDTTPSGEAFYSSGNTSYPAWKAFDGDNTTFANFTNAVDEYIGYEFPSAVVVKHIDIIGEASSGTEFYIEGANSKTGTYTPLGTFTGTTGSLKGIDVNNSTAYKSYRLRIKTKAESWNRFATYTIQFYAKDGSWLESICNSTYFESVLNVKVPTMTGYTTPSGEVIYSSEYGGSTYGYYAWKAFDGSDSTRWSSNNPTNEYCGYVFTNNVKVYMTTIYPIQSGGNEETYSIQNSDDNSSYRDLYKGLYVKNSTGILYKAVFANKYSACKYYRVFATAGNNNCNITMLQFYGRSAS